jgi:SNF2 family DNA or RNA helicase
MPINIKPIVLEKKASNVNHKDEPIEWKTFGQEHIKVKVNPAQKKLIENLVPEKALKLDLKDRYWSIDKKYIPAIRLLFNFSNKQLLDKWLSGEPKTLPKQPSKPAPEAPRLPPKPPKVPREYIDSFPYKKAPFGHQKDFLEVFFNKEKMLLADDQGLGKSCQAINAALILKKREKIKNVLIICGVNSLKYNWANEIEIFSDESYTIIEGSTQKKLSLLKEKTFFKIVNIEALRKKEIIELLLKIEFGLCIFDEIHKAKNPQSKQGKNLLKLNDMKYMLGLTGTPLINKPLDLFVPLRWLGKTRQSFWSFRKTYADLDYFGNPTKYKNLNLLKQIYDESSLRRTKKEVLDLPEKVYSNEVLDFGKDQEEIYRMVRENCIKELRESYDANINTSNFLAKLTRLRQVTTDPSIIDPSQYGVKIERMLDLLEEALEGDNKVVIFVNWVHAAENIFNLLRERKYNPVMFTGKVSLKDRADGVKKFQENAECKVCVGTYKAMGTGLTLTAANTVFLIDKPWTYADLIQGIDRCHRIGQKKTTYVINFKVKNSVDEVVEAIIETKKNLTNFANEKFTPEALDKFIKML